MRNPTLLPKVRNSYRVVFIDNQGVDSRTDYFRSLQEVVDVMNQIDLERFSVTVQKVRLGDEFISEWVDPRQGQHYKMDMAHRSANCITKSFFLCKDPQQQPAWFMVLLYINQPKSMRTSVTVEIRSMKTDGTLLGGEAIVQTFLPDDVQDGLTDEGKDEILNWYIDNFVRLYSPEDIDFEWLKKSSEEKKDEMDELKLEEPDLFDRKSHKCLCQHVDY